MFWGLILKANKKYTQTTKQAFHISQATLDLSSCSDGPVQLFLTYENIKYLICNLRKTTAEQVMLDLNFNEGDEISLQSQGGTIHISGYVTELNDPFDNELDDEESEDEEEQVPTKKSKKIAESKANNSNKKAAANQKVEAAAEEDDDDDEDDSDFNGELGAVEDGSDDEEDEEDDEDAEEDDDDDDDDDDDEEDESEDEEVQQPKAKQPKLEKPKQNGLEVQKKEGKQKKDKKDVSQQQQQPAQKQKGGEQNLAGGVKVEDIRVGNGPEAKPGKRAQVYYEGRLKSNNKVFDSLKQGAPFKFGLGRGEVIKGWDVGVAGMKVGGKRRITCPPHMAYGARGSPPTIPPNSTLVFEVELKGVQ